MLLTSRLLMAPTVTTMICTCGLVAKFRTCPSFAESYTKCSKGVPEYSARRCGPMTSSDLLTPSLIATDGTTMANFVNP